MAHGDVYVAHVAFGAKDQQTVKAFMEAESYPGTSLIIAYSHCIAHGYDLAQGISQQKLAVDSGYWPLYRYDPRKIEKQEPALMLDSGPPTARLSDFAYNESRFRLLLESDPARAKMLLARAETDRDQRYALYERLAQGGPK
jgi:pyruvate-ferredoxin/flavodoxin oxidoreductase